MKTALIVAALLVAAGSAQAQQNNLFNNFGSNSGFGTSSGDSHSRSGYVTQNGTYVAPSHATNPNNTQRDNYSSQGNVNPYTGAVGTRQPRY